jgi:hypothetical protein
MSTARVLYEGELCRADGGHLFIDGKPVPDTCTGSWQTFPELAAPGNHLLAFQASPGHTLGPWFAAMVVTGG